MITSLRLTDFKGFADERLRMGPFTVIVGDNAAGKSNIRDALRFLHGIGRGYKLAEITGGKYGPGGDLQWDGIRGAPNEIVRIGDDGQSGKRGFALDVEMQLQTGITETPPDTGIATYAIRSTADSGSFRVVEESLRHGRDFVYNSRPGCHDNLDGIAVGSDQPALTQIHEHKRVLRLHSARAQAVARSLASMRFPVPAPNRMREPSFPGQTTLGDRGDNLPTALKDICDDPSRQSALIDWTRELTSMDVADFKFPIDPISGKVHLLIREKSGRCISAYSASDGTLRILAVLATLFGSDQANLYFFEGIDNGIHPSRLHLLLELIESWTAERGGQVVTTTHSSAMLAMISDTTFDNTAVVCRRPDTGDAVVRQAVDLPNVNELRGSQGLGALHASGWLEDAIFLSE